MSDRVKIVWMDDNVRTYNRVQSADTNDKGELVISFTEIVPPPHNQGRERENSRTVRFPLANIRWWGTPGKEVAW